MDIDKVINGWTFEETVKTAESLIEVEKNVFKWDVIRHLRDFAENYRKRLKEYQRLEEQGRLIKLPCKVGTNVYYILGIPNETPCAIESCVFQKDRLLGQAFLSLHAVLVYSTQNGISNSLANHIYTCDDISVY